MKGGVATPASPRQPQRGVEGGEMQLLKGLGRPKWGGRWGGGGRGRGGEEEGKDG